MTFNPIKLDIKYLNFFGNGKKDKHTMQCISCNKYDTICFIGLKILRHLGYIFPVIEDSSSRHHNSYSNLYLS